MNMNTKLVIFLHFALVVVVALLSPVGTLHAEVCPSGKVIVFSDNRKACLDDYPALRDLPVQVRRKEVSFKQAFEDVNGFLAVAGSRCGGIGVSWIEIPALPPARQGAIDSANNKAIESCKAKQQRVGIECECGLILNANALSTVNVVLDLAKGDFPYLFGLGSSGPVTTSTSPSDAKELSPPESGASADRLSLESEKEALKVLRYELQKEADSLRVERERLAKEKGRLAAASFAGSKNQGFSKKALVIGNDAYLLLPRLRNGREDARSVANMFSKLGYTVALHLDLTLKQMKDEFRNFKRSVNPGDEVVIFFAGHGVQIAGVNFLLPIDSSAKNEDEVRDDAISLQRIIEDTEESKARLALLVIDACRDNPFKVAGRSIGGNRGLAAASPATGQMIVFSAGAGQQALDNLGPTDTERNSVFTRAFLKEALKQELTVDQVIRNVRREVVEQAKSIGHDQVPAIYDQLVGDYHLAR